MSRQVYLKLVAAGAPTLDNRPSWRYRVTSTAFDDINPAVVYVQEERVSKGRWWSSTPRVTWAPIGQGYPVVTEADGLRPIHEREWEQLFAQAATDAYRSAERVVSQRRALDIFHGIHP